MSPDLTPRVFPQTAAAQDAQFVLSNLCTEIGKEKRKVEECISSKIMVMKLHKDTAPHVIILLMYIHNFSMYIHNYKEHIACL